MLYPVRSGLNNQIYENPKVRRMNLFEINTDTRIAYNTLQRVINTRVAIAVGLPPPEINVKKAR